MLRKILCLAVSLYFHYNVTSQVTKRNIGISIPVIWNNSEATYYQLGSPKYPRGNAVSYGLAVNYFQPFPKSLYAKISVGYFKQNFKIARPFNYEPNPLLLIYKTQSYHYNNVELVVGLGYIKKIRKNSLFTSGVSFSWFHSFSQKYIVNKANYGVQNDKKSFPLGQSVNLEFGITENISQKISLGMGLLIPIYTHWNKDEIFYNLHYSYDEQQIARNKFSAGIVVSCNYNF